MELFGKVTVYCNLDVSKLSKIKKFDSAGPRSHPEYIYQHILLVLYWKANATRMKIFQELEG